MMAARHLLQRGCKTMAWFGHGDAPEFQARKTGFLAGLPDELRKNVEIIPIPITPEGSHAAAQAYFTLGHRPDGVFAASDVAAMSVCAAATRTAFPFPTTWPLSGSTTSFWPVMPRRP
jgi:DNA-binding LacI/PurR family transcriptional regulator